MQSWMAQVPPIDWAMAVALLVAALMAVLTSHRGGRFRGLLGWAGFWCVFAVILVALSRIPPLVSLALLALLMFAGLRTYFFIVPARPKDRYALLAAYLAIPIALYPGWTGSPETFLATVPIMLFLLFPVLLAIGLSQQGYLDAVGRLLLGVLVFVFCTAHLALLIGWEFAGLLELYGILVLAAELPQRLIGRVGQTPGWVRATLGVAASGLLTAGLGYWIGPWCGLDKGDAARAGALVAAAVTMGTVVSEAVVLDLRLGSTRVGRGAFLDRAVPAVYAAPVFFHYLNHFA